MALEIPVKSGEFESTPTREESQPYELGIERRDHDIEHRSPPAHLLLDVVMTFSGTTPRLTIYWTDIVAEGVTIVEAFRRLIEATRERLTSPDDRRRVLLDYYPPVAWFRFVPPGETPKTLTERVNEAYDEDARREDEEFFRTTKAYYRRRRNTED